MYLRKLAAAAGFATGAALAFAPLAAADLGDTVTTTLDSEISSQNSLFETYALLAGDYADVTKHAAPAFDTILPKDIPHITDPADASQVTAFESELYGVNPIAAGISGGTGPYNEFNGALTQFDNAYNAEVYSAANGGHLDTTVTDYIQNSTTTAVLGTANETPTQAFDAFYNQGIGDLGGYFQTNLSFLDINPAPAADAASTVSIASTLTSEANSLNSIFASDVAAAGINADKIIPGTGVLPFDTIDTANTNSTFDTLVFGLNPASVTGDPGAYDVFNGSLGEYANAFNVEYYSLLNSGDLLPAADIIGTHAELATVATSVAEYLQLGLSDLAGYF